MAVLPLAEIVWRSAFRTSIPGAGPFVQHLTLWVGFLGAAIAAHEGRLLGLATGMFLPEGRPRDIAGVIASTVGAAVSTLLALASFEMVRVEREGGVVLAAGVPVWVGQVVLPISFALIALRLAWRAPAGGVGRTIVALGIVVIWLALRHVGGALERPIGEPA